MASFTIYEVRFGVGNCLHYGVFVQTGTDGAGMLMDVRGSVNAGGKLVFNSRGEMLKNICRGVDPPDTQYGSTPLSGGSSPICRCSEWNDRVWSAIYASGIVKGQFEEGSQS
ncbi:hypothetical protein VFPPC_17517 [Pochonia chlamydosporia 170]|uniref:Uncharacterized protein n=1 Tax=Pochonia chlamydosporia 170 TaxID=1380566 RepID=A0A219ARD0_METCM|nr:hypothetical protein VFPPC_17517 [Pochonia chlamydosporia 170]OWT43320.1 hypothetical protein VFPPC_17517 [Pochonia chlamydosporia 170]